MNNLKYTIELDAKGKLISSLQKIQQQMDAVRSSVKRTKGQFEKLTDICDKVGNMNWAAEVLNIKNFFDGLADASLGGIAFEQSMADLKAITGIVGKGFDKLAESARKVGRETGLGAQGAVEAYTLLASQINIDKIGIEGLMRLQRETITLAKAGGISLSDSATAMAATINQFGLNAGEAARVVNVLAAGSKYGAAEVVDLAQSFKVAGATAAAAGLTVEDTAGAIEVLSQMNVKGSEAGTALRNVIVKLQTALGMDLSRTGLAAALETLKPKLNDVSYLANVFGAENIAAAQYLIENSAAVREMTDAVTATNTAQEQAAIRTETMGERMKVIRAHIEDMKIGLFNATGGLTGYASALGDTAVMISQLLPLGGVLKNIAVGTIALSMSIGSQLTTSVKAAASAWPGFIMNLQFMSGMVLSRITMGIRAMASALTLQNMAAKAAAAGTAALNAVMSANPIVIVATAVAALAAGIAYAYRQSEQFRAVVDKLWEGAKRIGTTLVENVVSALKSVWKWGENAWNAVKRFLGFGDDVEKAGTSGAYNTNPTGKKTLGIIDTETTAAITTMDGLKKKIQELQEAQGTASLQRAVALEKEIRLYKEKLNLIQLEIEKQLAGNISKGGHGALSAKAIPEMEIPAIKIPIEFDKGTLARSWAKCQKQFSDTIREVEITGQQIGDILTGSIQQFAAGFGEAIVSGDALNIFKSMLVSLMGMLQQFGAALIAAGTATLAFKSMFLNPFAAIISGAALVAATAAAKAALQNATAFANGGIVSGPTYALVGEYAGARNNPEVIAPLDKLKSMIEPARRIEADFSFESKIKGKDLYIALQGVERERRRTR